VNYQTDIRKEPICLGEKTLPKIRIDKTIVQGLSIVILLTFSMASVLPFSFAEAAPWNPGGATHPYLTPKWTASVSGGGEALLTADVRSYYAGEEVFHAGGPVQPS